MSRTLLAFACFAGLCSAQPRFDVASIKTVEVVDPRFADLIDHTRSMLPASNLPVQESRLKVRSFMLKQLIAAAFRMREREIDGPEWLNDKRFDVDAIIPPEASTKNANEMLQTLLQERFGLHAHITTGETPGYVLSVAKGGPKLKLALSSPSIVLEPPSPENLARRDRKPGLPGSERYEFRHQTMPRLADALANLLHSPVEDRTELNGKYDVVIDLPPPFNADDRDPRSRILDAVRNLGLVLKPGKVTVQALVVENVSKMPTPN